MKWKSKFQTRQIKNFKNGDNSKFVGDSDGTDHNWGQWVEVRD